MSEVRYVQRDPVTGVITGHFANEQLYAKEALPIDHPEIQDWYKKIADRKLQYLNMKQASSPEVLLAKINELEKKNQALAVEIAAIKSTRG